MRPDVSSSVRLIVAALLSFAALLNAPAAAPANDRCTNAMVIPASGPFPHLTAQVDITDATTNGDPSTAACQMDVSRSVWYTFRPTAADVYRISTCAESGAATTVRDTVMAVYTNATGVCGGTYTQIPDGCSDDTCNKQSEITTMLRSGVTYFIVVWQYGTTAPVSGQGLVQLFVQRGRPLNEDCSSPQPVQLNVPVVGRTLYARNDYDFGNSVCFTGVGQTPVDTPGLDVVFSFTAPSNDTYSFKVKNYNLAAEPDYDLVLYVSPVCPATEPGGVTINDCLGAANRNLSIAEEVLCVPLTNSQQVFIFVDDRHDINRGSSFALEVTRCIAETEPNSTPTEAEPYVFEVTSGILPINETDYFALGRFTPGSRVFALIDSISANVPNFDVWVISSTDTLEYDTDNNDIPYGQASGSVAGTPVVDDCTWLRIRHSPAISEPYRLYAVVQPPSSNATAEIEPNGIIAQAQSAANNYFTGNLPTMTDEDIFAFDAVAGDVMFLGLDADPTRNRTPIDAQLELLNSNGGILMLVDDPSATSNTNASPGVIDALRPFSPSETIVCRAPYSGRYYARVLISPFAPANTQGDYLLSITRNGFLGAGATNRPPSIVDLSAPPVPANTNATVTGTIIDPDAGPAFSVLINWGDGTSNILALGTCEYSFEAGHQYPGQGTYPVTVTVRDMHSGSASAATTIQVNEASTAPANMKSIAYRSDGSVLLQLEGTPGATYRIQVSQDLLNWTTLTTRTADPSGNFQLINSPPLPQRRFYRAVWP